jgi:hypothetical protein
MYGRALQMNPYSPDVQTELATLYQEQTQGMSPGLIMATQMPQYDPTMQPETHIAPGLQLPASPMNIATHNMAPSIYPSMYGPAPGRTLTPSLSWGTPAAVPLPGMNQGESHIASYGGFASGYAPMPVATQGTMFPSMPPAAMTSAPMWNSHPMYQPQPLMHTQPMAMPQPMMTPQPAMSSSPMMFPPGPMSPQTMGIPRSGIQQAGGVTQSAGPWVGGTPMLTPLSMPAAAPTTGFGPQTPISHPSAAMPAAAVSVPVVPAF